MGIYEKVGAKIKYARKAKGLKQQDLAKELKLSRASMVNIEAGRQHITLDKLIKICELSGFKISEFLEDSGRELPERIEYVSKIDIAILARLEEIPDNWLKALIRMYKSVSNNANAEESNCTIFGVSGSALCHNPRPNCFSGICETCGQSH
jgi:transcriptional regulator with XRE-family HTH domain